MVDPLNERMKVFLKGLGGLDDDAKKRRFAELKRRQPGVYERLMALMQVARKAEDAAGLRGSDVEFDQRIRAASQTPRIQQLAGTLDQLSGAQRHRLMNRLEGVAPGLADAIQRAMFAFEDLQYGDAKGMQSLLATTDRKTLLRALRLTSDEVKTALLRHVSTRVAVDVCDALDAMPRIRRTEALEAQGMMLSAAKQMIEAGTLTVIKPSQSDEWVD
ncbi:MAG: FliG C-terminal domain-containing protein [Myxococcota bacterium]|nr:FliG C-terminal domain-containing protein [Myxococcota bacterium]